MIMIILIVVFILLICSAHIFSAIKSACFYAKGTRNADNPKLKIYVRNLHFVQTPFWYSLFGAMAVILFVLFRVMNPNELLVNILSAYLIAQGSSTMTGVVYQGYINIGSGLPFVNPNENKRMELANPFTGKTIWIKRFWYGKRRVYLSFVGLIMITLGLILNFNLKK